ncbi:MAG: hypothetical protein WCS01_04460 [bacterium]
MEPVTCLTIGYKGVGPYTLLFEIAEVDRPCKPLLQIDMSGDVALQTIPAPRNKPG